MNSVDVVLDAHEDIVQVVPIFPTRICENPKWPQLISTHIHHHIAHLLMLPQTIHRATNVRTNTLLTLSTRWSSSRCNCRTDCVSTRVGFQVVKVVLVWVFDSVGSSCVPSVSLPDASFSTHSLFALVISIHYEDFKDVLSLPTGWTLQPCPFCPIWLLGHQIHMQLPFAALTATLDSAE